MIRIIGIIVVLLFLTSCASLAPIPAEKQCSVDADCVPATCCHSADAVNKQSAPDCQDIVCTMQCEPETLDCGQGEIKCVNNQCIVMIDKVEELNQLIT